MAHLNLLIDEIRGRRIDHDRAADFLELAAFFSREGRVMSKTLASPVSIGGEEAYGSVDQEMKSDEGELVCHAAVLRIAQRRRVLGDSYPFSVDPEGAVVRFVHIDNSLGQIAYVLCLILSDIASTDPMLGVGLRPNEQDVRKLRRYFQSFATAALAAEINGRAWSFGFPRFDGSGFIDKLKEIWREIDDGRIERQEGASDFTKDDGIDVLAARIHCDRLPGFLFAAAQVATGRTMRMREKSLRGRLEGFKSRWFHPYPVTDIIPYMIVPFAIPRHEFVNYVRICGNVLHRLRIPIRVMEAEKLVRSGVQVEGYTCLASATEWLLNYRIESFDR